MRSVQSIMRRWRRERISKFRCVLRVVHVEERAAMPSSMLGFHKTPDNPLLADLGGRTVSDGQNGWFGPGLDKKFASICRSGPNGKFLTSWVSIITL